MPLMAISLLPNCAKGYIKQINPFCYRISNGQKFKVLNLADIQLDRAGQLGTDNTIKPTIDKMIRKLK